MAALESTELNYEISEPSRVHWRAIVAGFFVTLLSYLILMSLGVAVGASGLHSVVENGGEGAQTLGIVAAGWVLASVLISLFTGSYSSSRANALTTPRVGAIQGAVITSAFFILMISQAGAMMGSLGRGLGDITGNIMGQASNVAQNPKVSALVEDQIGDLKSKQPFDQVATGVLARLMRGDQDSAKNYLAAQTGISREQAQERLETLNAKLQTTLTQIGDKAAEAAKIGGWIAFGTLVLAAIAGVLGGATGAQVSLRRTAGATTHARRSHTRGHRTTATAHA